MARRVVIEKSLQTRMKLVRLSPLTPGFFLDILRKTQGQKNSSREKTQALFQPETQGTGGFFQNPGQKLNFNVIFLDKILSRNNKKCS